MTCWENTVDDLMWDNPGMPAAIGPEQVIELFGTSEGSVLQANVSAHVVVEKRRVPGLTASKMKRTDEFPRHKIPDSE
jgi:hypothetical protein